MKKFLTTITAAALVLSLTVPTALAVTFSPIRSYSDSHFTDVPDDWSLPYISACYELGLMSGLDERTFAPGGTVTLAEGIMVTVRIYDLWNYGTGDIPQIGDTWYQGAVNYALQNGILTEDLFPSDYTLPATRAQLAFLLSRALPAEEYTAINNIRLLPDVSGNDLFSVSIFTLYNAGILTGSDEAGTFMPDANITRAELAAILCRLVKPETRRQLALTGDVLGGSSVLPRYNWDTFGQDVGSGAPTVVLFYAAWCPSCQELYPSVDELYAAYGPQGINFGQVDVDILTVLASQYQIMYYPTLIIFKNGQEVKRIEGPVNVEECAQFLNGLL